MNEEQYKLFEKRIKALKNMNKDIDRNIANLPKTKKSQEEMEFWSWLERKKNINDLLISWTKQLLDITDEELND